MEGAGAWIKSVKVELNTEKKCVDKKPKGDGPEIAGRSQKKPQGAI